MSPENVNHDIEEAFRLYDAGEISKAREILATSFDGRDKDIAAWLGYIHSQSDSIEYDMQKAEEYYSIAAAQGHVDANFGLAGIYFEQGKLELALQHYAAASKAGNADCSMALYRLYKMQGENQLAKDALNIAAEQGHPLAIQKRSINDILLRNGIAYFSRGVRLYLENIPKLYRYIKENY